MLYDGPALKSLDLIVAIYQNQHSSAHQPTFLSQHRQTHWTVPKVFNWLGYMRQTGLRSTVNTVAHISIRKLAYILKQQSSSLIESNDKNGMHTSLHWPSLRVWFTHYPELGGSKMISSCKRGSEKERRQEPSPS